MEVKNFSGSIRMGGCFPATIDVAPIAEHESYGVVASAWTSKGDNEQGYSQFRRHNSRHEIGLFVFAYNDMTIPEQWNDSVVIWDSREHSLQELRKRDMSKDATPAQGSANKLTEGQ